MKRLIDRNWMLLCCVVVVGVLVLFGGLSTKSTEASSPTSANLAYVTGDYRAYCEVPTGNMVYVAKVNPGAGGAAITVVVGGCK